ncbi:MobA/MobL family protein [Leisingera aquaemixtae]|uniref:MobA/MobL family protein n=1 Tax=Leisingera aquaemixtae TaxID=1396826 RepID=UPI0021FBEAA3|nr:MobA/MobL family protein [Leisingera aquaemixtae]
MALFSLRHSTKTFSEKREGVARAAKPGQMAAHLRYITRPKAARVVLRQRVDATDRHTAKTAEDSAQKRKGRVAERFIIALPVEASPGQREALASAFAEKLTDGKAGYILAIHDKAGNDKDNPHMHLVAFDAFEKTGGRGRPRSVIGMARKGAVERTAAMWAGIHNEMMHAWGHSERSMISHQSNEARGIERIPTIHEGPAARKMAGEGKKPKSKPEWRRIDGGHSRHETNRLIHEINNLKDQRTNARGTHRLGGHDKSGQQSGQASRPKQRANPGWSSGSAPHPKEPSRSPLRPQKDPNRAARPPVGQKQREAQSQRNAPPWNHSHSKKMANRPYCVHRRRKRRVTRLWYNLILLRKTLQARLSSSIHSTPYSTRNRLDDPLEAEFLKPREQSR